MPPSRTPTATSSSLDVANNRILEEAPAIPPAGPVFSVVYSDPPGTTPLTLNSTSGLAIDGTGTLYISSGASVYSFLPGATQPTALLTTGVTLKTPTGLAIDPRGDLFIADSTNNAVYEVPLGGGAAAALPLSGLSAPAVLAGPTGLAVNELNDLTPSTSPTPATTASSSSPSPVRTPPVRSPSPPSP